MQKKKKKGEEVRSHSHHWLASAIDTQAAITNMLQWLHSLRSALRGLFTGSHYILSNVGPDKTREEPEKDRQH